MQAHRISVDANILMCKIDKDAGAGRDGEAARCTFSASPYDAGQGASAHFHPLDVTGPRKNGKTFFCMPM
jgi:hypothetical protein